MNAIVLSSWLLLGTTETDDMLQDHDHDAPGWAHCDQSCATCLKPGYAEIKTCDGKSRRVSCVWANNCSCQVGCEICDGPGQDDCRSCAEGYLIQDEFGTIHAGYDDLGKCVVPSTGGPMLTPTQGTLQMPEGNVSLNNSGTKQQEAHKEDRGITSPIQNEAQMPEGTTALKSDTAQDRGITSTISNEKFGGGTTTPATTTIHDLDDEYETVLIANTAADVQTMPLLIFIIVLLMQ